MIDLLRHLLQASYLYAQESAPLGIWSPSTAAWTGCFALIAIAAGLWKGAYASVNHHEYFAEGVQSWFDNNRSNDAEHNDVDTREELIAYDPRLAELCREVFGDTELRYTKPSTRLHSHLAGYDPTRAPSFKWPPRLQAAQQAIREQVTARRKEAFEPASKQLPKLVQPSSE